MAENKPWLNNNNTYDDGNEWDRVGLEAIKSQNHKVLCDTKSKYQDINIVEVKDIRMYLNDHLQFSSLDERIYHEALVHPPMTLAKVRTNVLILGGGDGLALREVLKYPDVDHVDLVDIDAEIIKVARSVPELVKLNESSFFDKRVRVHVKDALRFIRSNTHKYNVIIVDFPDPTNVTLSKLYTTEVFTRLKRFLPPGGVIVCQSNSPDDTPILFWSIGRTMWSAGLNVMSYHTIIPSFGDWGFHLAARSANTDGIGKLSIKVPHRTLPKNLDSLCRFRDDILSNKKYAVVNSQDNLRLHDIFQEEV
ncbi:spermidine synthase [Rossellomorea sp. BNER]|uniref:spermine/spermidine synthase domain-containing protein n=1 Tax=Rossellomorea sp. BNER TaxID=2962031 RepID=UPI003AF28506|nr:spermidine synthase [Rossellomorea sp. BNER]